METAVVLGTPRNPEIHRLEAVGNTIRHRTPVKQGVHAALVVGDSLTSHFWLNILPMAQDAALRFYVTVDDLAALAGRLHVRPDVIPSFLVFSDTGFAIDWFPAPLPAPGQAVEHTALVEAVRSRLRSYGGGAS